VLLVLLAGAALGDEIKLTSGLTYRGTVSDYREGHIYLTLRQGRNINKPLDEVASIVLDGQTTFNAAEAALAKNQHDEAVKLYDRAVRDATGWQTNLMEARRFEALSQSGQIDRAIGHWLAMLDSDGPKEAILARQPATYGPAGSTANEQAINMLAAKIRQLQGGDNKAYLRAVLAAKLAIERADGREQAAGETAAQLQQLGGHVSRPPVEKASPQTGPAPEAEGTSFTNLRTMLENGQAQAVAAQVTRQMASCDMQKLPEALTLLGRSQLAMFETGGGQDKSLLVRAGKHLVLVYAEFPSMPEAAEALYYAALVNQHLGDTEAVRAVLNAIIEKYPQTRWAQAARRSLGEGS
jgi:tetratricopeptide (TPR) repeat protein